MQAQGLQYYDITIPANTSRQLAAPGSYFRYYSGQAGGLDETITLKSGNGAVMCLLKPGQSIKLPEAVTDWQIGNYANAATITGMVVVGDGEIQDSSIAGSVSVIDGGFARTNSKVAFLGQSSIAATPGLYSHCAIFNPLASGKVLVLEAMAFSASAAAVVWLGGIAAALATAGAASNNKLLGSSATAANLCREANAGILMSTVALGYQVAAGSVQTINFKEPIVINPGFGFCAALTTANLQLNANYEYYEK